MKRFHLESYYHGKGWVDDGTVTGTVHDARITACRKLRKGAGETVIYAYEGPKGAVVRKQIESIFVSADGEYAIHTRGKLRRVSPKTGNLLDYDRYWKYL